VSRLIPRAQHHNSDSSLADYQPNDEQSHDEQPNKYSRWVGNTISEDNDNFNICSKFIK